MPIKSFTQVDGALEPGKRDADRVSWSRTSGWSPRRVGGSCLVASQGGCSAWVCVSAAATCSAAFFVTSSVCLLVEIGEALRYAPSGAGVLVDTLRELATRLKSTSTSGKGSGEGAGARVAVRSVLEDHETAVLELERVVSSIEDRMSELEHVRCLVAQLDLDSDLWKSGVGLWHCWQHGFFEGDALGNDMGQTWLLQVAENSGVWQVRSSTPPSPPLSPYLLVSAADAGFIVCSG